MAATTTIPSGPQASNALADYNEGNTTIANSLIVQGWISEPSVRGTWSLLYSCIFTIGICVWTCIHPNIPKAGKTRVEVFSKKFKWVLIALLSPEIVLAMALAQFKQARQLRADLNAAGDQESRFDLTFCYYAVMGGFVVDVAHRLESEHVVSLTPDAIVKIKEAGKADCLEITSDAIQDRSKADLLAKTLAVCQITWVVVQSIARLRAQLPLTVLEVHTMVHVLSAICMYICWWHKPKDVTSTTKINSTNIGPKLDSMFRVEKRGNAVNFILKDAFYVSRAKNFNTLGSSNILYSLVGPVLLSIVYAALHMTISAQWGAHGHYFPTAVEAKLWDAANYVILGVAITFVPFFFISLIFGACDEICLFLLPAFYAVVMGSLVVAAKLYVTLESFISLRAVPLATYAIPGWTMFIPHF